VLNLFKHLKNLDSKSNSDKGSFKALLDDTLKEKAESDKKKLGAVDIHS